MDWHRWNDFCIHISIYWYNLIIIAIEFAITPTEFNMMDIPIMKYLTLSLFSSFTLSSPFFIHDFFSCLIQKNLCQFDTEMFCKRIHFTYRNI